MSGCPPASSTPRTRSSGKRSGARVCSTRPIRSLRPSSSGRRAMATSTSAASGRRPVARSQRGSEPWVSRASRAGTRSGRLRSRSSRRAMWRLPIGTPGLAVPCHGIAQLWAPQRSWSAPERGPAFPIATSSSWDCSPAPTTPEAVRCSLPPTSTRSSASRWSGLLSSQRSGVRLGLCKIRRWGRPQTRQLRRGMSPSSRRAGACWSSGLPSAGAIAVSSVARGGWRVGADRCAARRA